MERTSQRPGAPEAGPKSQNEGDGHSPEAAAEVSVDAETDQQTEARGGDDAAEDEQGTAGSGPDLVPTEILSPEPSSDSDSASSTSLEEETGSQALPDGFEAVRNTKATVVRLRRPGAVSLTEIPSDPHS